MAWDLCSSPLWVPFYPYSMFMNLIPRPSCQKSRNIIITQKVLATHSALCLAYPETYVCTYASLFEHFSLFKLTFFHVMSGGVKQTAKKFTFH